MDIGQSISSSLQPRDDGRCFVQFPSFTGYVDTAIYSGRFGVTKYGTSTLSSVFCVDGMMGDAEIVVLASQIFDILAVRLIDGTALYEEKFFFIESGEVFSFRLLDRVFYALVYTDTDGKRGYFTNIPEDSLFEAHLIGNTFSLRNSLSEITVFERTLSIKKKETGVYEGHDVIDLSQKAYYIQDPLFEASHTSIMKLLSLLPAGALSITQKGNIIMIDGSHAEKRFFLSLVGFIGAYTTILDDSSTSLSGYLRETDAGDGVFSLPGDFEECTAISSLDKRWHELRMGLLEICYLAEILTLQEDLLTKGMNEIDNLKNSHIMAMKIRLVSKLESTNRTLPQFLSQKELLINLLKNKLS